MQKPRWCVKSSIHGPTSSFLRWNSMIPFICFSHIHQPIVLSPFQTDYTACSDVSFVMYVQSTLDNCWKHHIYNIYGICMYTSKISSNFVQLSTKLAVWWQKYYSTISRNISQSGAIFISFVTRIIGKVEITSLLAKTGSIKTCTTRHHITEVWSSKR